MEEGTFRRPAVAGILEKHYVEARLHADYDEIKDLQLEMTGSLAQPIYLIVDPGSEEQLGRVDGLRTDAMFIAFLEDALEQSPKRAQLPLGGAR